MNSASTTHFSLLGVKQGFEIDLNLLEKNYHALARDLHPDRAGGGAKIILKMGEVNEAYRVLKNRETRRAYLLSLHGFQRLEGRTERPSAEMMQLAERWFDLEDAVSEASDLQTLVSEFLKEIAGKLAERTKNLGTLENQFDGTQDLQILPKIFALLDEKSYLESLEKQVLAEHSLKVTVGSPVSASEGK